MPLQLTILSPSDLADYAAGRIDNERKAAVDQLCLGDPDARQALAEAFEQFRQQQEKESEMTNQVLQPKADVEAPDTGLENTDRKRLSQGLTGVLADTYVLMVKTHGYHWNVVGPLFVNLHELTEMHYEALFAAADTLAERIRALGYPAPFGYAEMIAQSLVQEESEVRSGEEIVTQLIDDHETLVRRLREIIQIADSMDDYVTADLLTARMNFHEESIWMLRAIVAQ